MVSARLMIIPVAIGALLFAACAQPAPPAEQPAPVPEAKKEAAAPETKAPEAKAEPRRRPKRPNP